MMKMTPAIFLPLCFSAMIAFTGCKGSGESGNSSQGGSPGIGGNTPPVADAGLAQSATLGKLITLDGSNSTDPNGDLLNYRWAFISKPVGSSAVLSNPTAIRPTFTADALDEYVVELVVNDDRAISSPSRVTITVGENNLRPVANAGPDQTVQAESQGVLITLHGEESKDPEGNKLTYTWKFDNYPGSEQEPKPAPPVFNTTTANPTFTAIPGNYTVTLQVSDGTLLSPLDTVVIRADGGPTAVPDPACLSIPTDCQRLVEFKNNLATVTLDGSKSSDPNGDGFTYAWDFIQNEPGSSPTMEPTNTANPIFRTSVSGRYIVQLTVSSGSHPPNSRTMTILAIEDPQPDITLTPKSGKVLPNGLITLTGKTIPQVPEGTPLTYNWTVTRDGNSETPIFSSAGKEVSFNAPQDVADYTVSLTVALPGKNPSVPKTAPLNVKSVVAVIDGQADSNVSVCSRVPLRADTTADPLQLTWALPGGGAPSGQFATFFASNTTVPGGALVATVTNGTDTDTVSIDVDDVDRGTNSQTTIGHRMYHYGPDDQDSSVTPPDRSGALDCEECHQADGHDTSSQSSGNDLVVRLQGKTDEEKRSTIKDKLTGAVSHTGGKTTASEVLTCRINQLIRFLSNAGSVSPTH